jgi:2-oxoglutarate dehydrogenase E1 component
MRWAMDYNPALLGGDHQREQFEKQARVPYLINAYRTYGHLVADIDPLHAMPLHHHPSLDLETYGLTIWDLDREFITSGLAGKESLSLRKIFEILRRSYCGRVGVEYRHIDNPEQKRWLQERIDASRNRFAGTQETNFVEADFRRTIRAFSAHQVSRRETLFA